MSSSMSRTWSPTPGCCSLRRCRQRLGLEALIDATVRLVGRVGGARPGRKVLTLVHAMIAGASHIDHADMLRAGSTAAVLSHRVMAPSTLGTFLRAFTFGHVRQLEAVIGTGARTGLDGGCRTRRRTVGDRCRLDDLSRSTARHKQGAGFGYTQGARLPPDPRHPRRHRRGVARPDAQGPSQHPARRPPLPRRTHRPGAPRRRHRSAHCARRLGVLVQRHHHHLEPARRALHDGRALRRHHRRRGDRRHPRRGVGRHRLPRRRTGPGRRHHLHHRRRHGDR